MKCIRCGKDFSIGRAELNADFIIGRDTPLSSEIKTVIGREDTLAHCDINKWWWGDSHDIILANGYGSVSLQHITKESNTAWVCNLHVVSSMRSKGLGSLLLGICIKKAKENNATFLKLYVDKTKQWLIDWYTKNGFIITVIEEHEFEMTLIIK